MELFLKYLLQTQQAQAQYISLIMVKRLKALIIIILKTPMEEILLMLKDFMNTPGFLIFYV